jgi:hypothetical protein
MSNKLVDDLNRENLCTYFILPLTGVSKDTFMSGNFLDSFISMDRKSIAVNIIEPYLISPRVRMHYNFRGLKVLESWNGPVWMYEFAIPDQYMEDLDKFLNGQFSKMSEEAKIQIRKHSGLPYEKEEYIKDVGRVVSTDLRLCALDKNNTGLRNFWEKRLDVVLPAGMELLSIPLKWKTMIDLSIFKIFVPKNGTVY